MLSPDIANFIRQSVAAAVSCCDKGLRLRMAPVIGPRVAEVFADYGAGFAHYQYRAAARCAARPHLAL
jgi:hypothetical protein